MFCATVQNFVDRATLATGIRAPLTVSVGSDSPWEFGRGHAQRLICLTYGTSAINPYPTAFPYGNGMVLHFYQQQESSTTKTVHKVINKELKAYV